MNRFIATMMTVLPICMCIEGCKTTEEVEPEPKGSYTYAVVVGMENSRFAGSCPGARYDAMRMSQLLTKYTDNVKTFIDGAATKAAVKAALADAISKAGNGLVIFYYSGHGGSEPFPDTGMEEVDGMDEFLCLWDTYFRDNEIWSEIRKSRGRVMWITDSCHSETQFRSPGFVLTPPLAWDHKLNETQPFSLLCWSGCPDGTYSYGSSTGGQFTNALLRHLQATDTYDVLWEKIKGDKTLRRYEDPQSTAIGNGFDGKPIFR